MNIINTDNLLATVLDSTNIEFVDDQVLALRKNTMFFIGIKIKSRQSHRKNIDSTFLSLKEDKSYRKITEL